MIDQPHQYFDALRRLLFEKKTRNFNTRHLLIFAQKKVKKKKHLV